MLSRDLSLKSENGKKVFEVSKPLIRVDRVDNRHSHRFHDRFSISFIMQIVDGQYL